MTVILTLLHFATSPVAIPFWGALAFIVAHFLTLWNNERKLKLENTKIDLSDVQDKRKQDREDFMTIRDTLYKELDRMNTVQANTTRQLEESYEETKKCEQRYFELATQYRELLKYCANLGREVRELKAKVQAHVSKESNNEQTGFNSKATGSSDE